MTITFLYGFNNYFNRIVKKYDTLAQYKSAVPYYEYSDINFYVNDGVDTTQVINYGSLSGGTYSEGEPNCDYCIVSDTTGILSRWFVMEIKTNRKGQVTYTLHRDVIADNYNAVIDSPCYIQKATVEPSNDLIFNSEGMQFNQIKISEEKLLDQLETYYYVAYLANPIPLNTGETSKTITIPNADFTYEEVSNPNEFLYGTSLNSDYCNPFYYTKDINIRMTPKEVGIGNIHYILKIRGSSVTYEPMTQWIASQVPSQGLATWTSSTIDSGKVMQKICELLESDINTFKALIKAYIDSELSSTIKYANDGEFLTIQNTVGKNIHDNWVYSSGTSDAYFNYNKLSTLSTGIESQLHDAGKNDNLTLYLKNKTVASVASLGGSASINTNGTLKFQTTNVYEYQLLRRNITDVSSTTVTLRNDVHTSDAPYDILIIPESPTLIDKRGSSIYQLKRFESSYQEAFVKALNEKGTSEGWLYDLQRLPYSYLSTSNINVISQRYGDLLRCIDINSVTDRVLFDNTASTEEWSLNKIFAYYQPTKQFTFNIQKSIQVLETKIENECDMYRLVSPNGQGIFEFNLAKNDGVDYFNVDCTLRPISPYIHVNPNFKRLYSADYNDYKGLICGGDFSVATVSDRWLQYASQNKYYAQTFNREIENYDFNSKYAMLEQGLSAGASAVGTGVGAGIVTGNVGVGLAVGAASAGAGVADLFITQDRIREGKSLKTDLFNYSLRNVQAQPKSLVKTGSDDFNNKIFVTLEYYSCTDVEKEALRNKLKYNGMTVMTIGKISDYIQNEISYIQGQLIRIEGISEDTHMITQIAQEIAKGVYI